MRPLYSAESAKKLDHYLIEKHSLSESALIDSAAKEVFDAVRDKLLSKRVLFLIGPGNNGADGLEMARLLSRENQNISLFFLSENGSVETTKRRDKYSYINRAFEVSGYDVIVDALFGFSFRGEADDYLLEIINEVNSSGSFVISIDIPSANLIRADVTVSLMCSKLELYHPLERSRSEDSFLFDESDLSLKDIPLDGYKNTRGHVAVLGGSDSYPGAPILTSLAAFHAGAGLVTLISNDFVLERAFKHHPSIMQSNGDDLSKFSSLAIGPGWDTGSEKLLERAISSGKNMVIDADGIKLLKDKKLGHRAILTPHIGEYKRLCSLLGIDNGLDSADSLRKSLKALSDELECVVVLKSSTVWISNGESLFVFDGANPSLGVAGSGDVLCGIIASLLAQGAELLDAAINGVIMHQSAGRRAKERYGYYSAEELIGEIVR